MTERLRARWKQLPFWKWLVVALLAAYVVGLQPTVEFTEFCLDGYERVNQWTCHPIAYGSSAPNESKPPSLSVHITRRLGLYIASLRVSLFDVDLGSRPYVRGPRLDVDADYWEMPVRYR